MIGSLSAIIIIIINGLFAVIKYKVQSFKQSWAVYKILVLWNL